MKLRGLKMWGAMLGAFVVPPTVLLLVMRWCELVVGRSLWGEMAMSLGAVAGIIGGVMAVCALLLALDVSP